jgi:hypothetical protein
MSARLLQLGGALLLALVLLFSCRFEPDLSRFEPCAGDGTCPTGYTCLPEVQRCLPDCSDSSLCPPPEPPDAGTDAGPKEDGGVDAGMDAGVDAGVPFSLATQKLSPAVEGIPYSMELLAQGGTPPYGFQPKKPLPEGLMLDAGVLSGQLDTLGTFSVEVEASDSDEPPSVVSAEYALRVRPQLRVAGPRTLVTGYTSSYYTEKVSAVGGIPPYSFAYVSGNLPQTLTLTPDGTVQGTPSSSGNYSFRVRVTDSDPEQPQTAEEQLTLAITGAPLLLTISTESVPDGRRGTSYQYALRLSSGATVTWSLKAGALPGGVGLDTRTGFLSGTPNAGASGDFTFTIYVTDGGLASAEKTFTMRVY